MRDEVVGFENRDDSYVCGISYDYGFLVLVDIQVHR